MRTAVVVEALQPVLAALGGPEHPGDVLDIGGGTGVSAVVVAEAGHRVTVVDPSPDALAALARRADEHGVADLVTGVQGDLDTLAEVAAEASADLVLCHGVLEVVADPPTALAAIARVLRPGGTLSLLVGQQHAAVLAQAMAGRFSQARAMLDDAPPHAGQRRFTEAEVGRLLDDAGFDVLATHAVRVFADLVPGALVDLEPGATDALIELERAVAERPEYRPLATQLHLLARTR